MGIFVRRRAAAAARCRATGGPGVTGARKHAARLRGRGPACGPGFDGPAGA